jgi:dynactin complex subunit
MVQENQTPSLSLSDEDFFQINYSLESANIIIQELEPKRRPTILSMNREAEKAEDALAMQQLGKN